MEGEGYRWARKLADFNGASLGFLSSPDLRICYSLYHVPALSPLDRLLLFLQGLA